MKTTFEHMEIDNEFKEDYGLEFYETIPTLQEMASNAVAIALWKKVILLEDSEYNASEFEYEKILNEVENSLQYLPVPRVLKEFIRNSLDLEGNEMNEWSRYYAKHIFNGEQLQWKNSDLEFCQWFPNGKIDHRKSAVNMLSNSRLTAVNRFKIMCKFCLENEINNLHADSIPRSFVESYCNLDKRSLTYYWLCRVFNHLDKLPKINDESIECYLIGCFSVDTWPAIEYFWNRLSIVEQSSKIGLLLSRKPAFQRQLFLKMNEFQKYHVLSTMTSQVMMNFWKQNGDEKFAYLVWLRIKNTLTYDQFIKLIYALLCESLPNRVEKIKYLIEIWKSAPDNYANQALQSMINIVVFLHAKFYPESSCDLEFLLVFCSYGDAEFRKNFIFEHGDYLVLHNNFSMIDKLVELCLPNPDDVVEFKKLLMKSDCFLINCSSFLNGLDCDLETLMKVLDHYCPDMKAKIIFANEVLDTWTMDNCISLMEWSRTIESINKHILDALPDPAIKFKKRVIRSFAPYCIDYWSNADEIRALTDSVDRTLDPGELYEFKNYVSQTLLAHYCWHQFDDDNIRSFLAWCFDNDEHRMRQFKKSLPIDDIFTRSWQKLKWNEKLESYLTSDEVCAILAPIDKMLVWYFENIDDAKMYKLNKIICDYRHCKIISFMKCYDRVNRNHVKNILPWFFHYDYEEIRKFKEQCEDDMVTKIFDVE